MKRKQTAKAGLNIRLLEPLRAKIEKAAESRGVSMNAEMVDRLDRSFRREEQTEGLLTDALTLAYGRRFAALLTALADVMNAAGHHADLVTKCRNQYGRWRDLWLENSYAYRQAAKAANKVLDLYAPPGEQAPPKPVTDEERRGKFWGISARTFLDMPDPGEEMLEALRGAPATRELRGWAESLVSVLKDTREDEE